MMLIMSITIIRHSNGSVQLVIEWYLVTPADRDQIVGAILLPGARPPMESNNPV
jgi:hypothetical protein